MPPSFGVIYLFAPKLAPVMIAFLIRRFKQCSNQSSHLVRAAHQIPIILLRADTINILLHCPVFLSAGTLSPAPLFFSFLKNRSIPPLPRFQAILPLATRTRHLPSAIKTHLPPAMASFSEIPQVRYSIFPATIAISVLKFITPLSFPFLES